jgi:hypothetical protein
MALVSFGELKTLYGMPTLKDVNKVQYENLLATAEEEVLAYAGISLGEELEEKLSGATAYILVGHPVKEIKSVEGATNWTFDVRTNILSVPTEDEVTVSYSTGCDSVPRIVKQCIAITVQYWAKFINSNMVGVNSRSTDVGSETLEQYELPLVVKSSLDRFRRVIY